MSSFNNSVAEYSCREWTHSETGPIRSVHFKTSFCSLQISQKPTEETWKNRQNKKIEILEHPCFLAVFKILLNLSSLLVIQTIKTLLRRFVWKTFWNQLTFSNEGTSSREEEGSRRLQATRQQKQQKNHGLSMIYFFPFLWFFQGHFEMNWPLAPKASAAQKKKEPGDYKL